MTSRDTERDFLSAFLGSGTVSQHFHPQQQVAAEPLFKSATRKLHTGYIRPHHLIGAEAKTSSKFLKVSEDDFWDSKDASLWSQVDDESLPNTAAKVPLHRNMETAKLIPFKSFGTYPNHTVSDDSVSSIDSILNRVRPGLQLNRVQSSVKNCIFNSNESSVVGAPTGNIDTAQYSINN